MKKEFHHVGIATTQKRPNEILLDGLKLYTGGKPKEDVLW